MILSYEKGGNIKGFGSILNSKLKIFKNQIILIGVSKRQLRPHFLDDVNSDVF